jgi:AcrR family transcriptional regulator
MALHAVAKPAKSPWATARDRESERAEKREAVLHAAAQAFSEKGYYRTSLDDIADRLGITKPTLYYYAKNKEDLIAAVMDRALEQMLVDLPIDPHASAYDQLRVFLKNYAEVAATDFGTCLIQLRHAGLSDATDARIRTGKAAIDTRIRHFLKLGIADGSVADCDVKLTAFMIAGAVNGISHWYRPGAGFDAASVAEVYVNQLGAGLRPRV